MKSKQTLSELRKELKEEEINLSNTVDSKDRAPIHWKIRNIKRKIETAKKREPEVSEYKITDSEYARVCETLQRQLSGKDYSKYYAELKANRVKKI